MSIPRPRHGQSYIDFLNESVPFMIKEGYSERHSIAICKAEIIKKDNITNQTFKEFTALLQKIFEGNVSLFSLNLDAALLYEFTFNALDDELHAAWGKLNKTEQVLQYEKAVNYRQNISRFSGAKTFQQAKALTQGVFDIDGTKRSFKDFKEVATRLNVQFNKTWLKTEQDTTFLQSQNAKQGLYILDEKEIFPFVKYQTSGDGRVRASHAALDGLVLKADDPRWDDIMPQNGWRCRCKVIQLREAKTTSPSQTVKKTRLMNKEFRKDSEFKHNPAKVDYVFKEKGKDKHEYFKVPRQFSKQLKLNFGFPVPKEY